MSRNGIAEAERVDGEQEPRPRPADSVSAAALRIAARVGPTQGVQAIAKAAPATSGPPLPARSISASTRHSRLSRHDEEAGDEEHAHDDDQDPGDVGEQVAVLAQRLADAGRREAEEDEDRREGGDEEQAGDDHPAPVGALELGHARRR